MRRVFLLLYTASGAAALVYEIVWTRQLTLLMGHTVAAASTVLAAMMGGLALGSWLAGRAASLGRGREAAHGTTGQSRALLIYAALEIGVALFAIALPVLLAASAPALAWAYYDGQAPVRFGLVRFLVSIVLVGAPATAMGATFPVAVAWYATKAAEAGALYAANTAGAAAGAFATGFWLIPSIGMRGTTWIAVALNLLAAAGALRLAASPTQPERDARAPDRRKHGRRSERGPAVSAIDGAPALAMTAAALSGFCALVYEVIWTRLVALVVGPTTYAFATVVASFIIGIAIGAAIAARLLRRIVDPAAWLGLALLVAAAAASIAGWFAAARLPLLIAGQVAAANVDFTRFVLRQVTAIVVLLLPLTISLGAAFSFALATASGAEPEVAARAARVYGANTAGAILGSLTAGFVLLPLFGLQNSLRLIAGVGIAASAFVWAAGRPIGPARLARTFALVAAAALLFALPGWDVQLLAGGAYKYARYSSVADLENELRAWRLIYYRDGSSATVTVKELAGQRSLVIDGKIDASNAADMLTQRLLGLLPVLMHPHPESVLVIGLGSGVTLDSALAPGTIRQADVVEISPEVVSASAFFSTENGGVLRVPGVGLIVGDGRSHLAFTRRRYDVIVSEPSNPWMAGIAGLFTREFFETARARLAPDGVICQWAHTYDIREADLKSIVRTFTSVFPESTMWLVGDGDLLLVGTSGPAIGPHLETMAQAWNRGRAATMLRDVAISERHMPFLIMSLLAGGPAEMRRYGGDAAIQNDDRMALEFSAPRAIYGPSSTDNAAAIRRLADNGPSPAIARVHWERATDDSWVAAGAMEMKAQGYAAAYDRYLRALVLNSANPDALAGLSDAAAVRQRPNDVRAELEARAKAEPGNVNVRIELSRVLAATGDMARGAAVADEAVRLAPDDPRAAEQLASVFADAGDGEHLGPLADLLASRFPTRDKARFYRATALMLNGDVARAIDEGRQLVARRPDDVRAQNLLGVACATAGEQECARAAFAAAVRTDPRDAATYVNLGVFQLRSGDSAAAAAQFSLALALDPGSAAAREGLAEAREALGRSR